MGKNIVAVSFGGPKEKRKCTVRIDALAALLPEAKKSDREWAEDVAGKAVESVKEMIEEVGLEGLNFVLEEGIAEAMLDAGNYSEGNFPEINFVAEDENCYYTISFGLVDEGARPFVDGSAIPGYDGVTGMIFRATKSTEKTEYSEYYFPGNCWKKASTWDVFRTTENQMEKYMQRKHTNSMGMTAKLFPEAILFFGRYNSFGPVTDREFEKVKRENSELLRLANLLEEGIQAGIRFPFESKEKAVLVPSCELDGVRIRCIDGAVHVQRNDDSDSFIAEDVAEAARWINWAYSKKYPKGTERIVPISKDSLMYGGPSGFGIRTKKDGEDKIMEMTLEEVLTWQE